MGFFFIIEIWLYVRIHQNELEHSFILRTISFSIVFIVIEMECISVACYECILKNDSNQLEDRPTIIVRIMNSSMYYNYFIITVFTLINFSLISQLKIPAFCFLSSSIRVSTSGVATRGFDPPITPGLIEPVSW